MGTLLSGDLARPVLDADAMACEGGHIVAHGAEALGAPADVELDARG
jgi:hypothetical protein